MGSREAAKEGPTVQHIRFCNLSQFQVAARSTSPDVRKVFHARQYGRLASAQSLTKPRNLY